jgi:hypothetical protein
MSQRFVISKKIRIGLSELINTPLTVGFLETGDTVTSGRYQSS